MVLTCECRRCANVMQSLVRYDLQPVSLAKPFVERCVGFFLHTEMMFRITRRELSDVLQTAEKQDYGEVAALPGAFDS